MKPKQENKKKGKYLLVGIGLGTIALVGLGYWYFRWRKGAVVEDPEKDLFHNLSKGNEQSTPELIPATNNGFPLKQGSRGALVKQVQEVLMNVYGKNILPKYGADGIFGKELVEALKSKGFPVIIDLVAFTKIVSSKNDSATVNTSSDNKQTIIDIAKKIWYNTSIKNLNGLLSELKRIKTTEEYKTVNELFKKVRLNGVRQTIVNAALSVFDDETSKQLIRNEFTRIGLKYNGEKWSLSGMSNKQLITVYPTTIRNAKGDSIEIPEQTILGVELSDSAGITAFSTIDNQTLYVPSKHVSHV